MSQKTKVIVVSIITTLIVFGIAHTIWPPSPHLPQPMPVQFAFFVLLAFIEAAIFGIGISFALFGFPLVKKITGQQRKLTWLMYISLIWLLMSWLPHESLHFANGEDITGLLFIEYGFHGTSMVATVIVAYGFLRMLTTKK